MKKTLLIIGAGASKAVYQYFPTGFELIEKINSHLFNDINDSPLRKNHEGEYVSDLTNKLVKMLEMSDENEDVANKLKIYKKALYDYWAHHESDVMRQNLLSNISIDDFTETNKEHSYFTLISQYATAHILRGTEHAYFQATNKSSAHWIKILCKQMDQKRREQLNLQDNLYVVSFNYDRLFPYLIKGYKFQEANIFGTTCEAFLKSSIHYMYGSLGSLEEIPFESPNDSMDKMIAAYTKFDLLTPKRPKKEWADKDSFDEIAFIGFGFDRLNFANLDLSRFHNCIVRSTFFGEEIPQHQSSLLENLFDKNKLLYHKNADELAQHLFTP
jgi:hypothetical protein